MICLTCREAADDQRPADQHCGSTGGPGAACTCQHRVDRYQGRDGQAAPVLSGIWETILRKYGSPEAQRPPACPCGAQRFAGQLIHEPGCCWRKTPAASPSEVARALGPGFWETVRIDPRADIPPYDGITGYRTWAEVEADPPHFTGLLALLQAQASREADHVAAVQAAIARVEAEHGPDNTITIPYVTTED